ncbi:MotE family protein [Aquicoccus sp. G2-2]|uniref:MotE family protein n=1 Tax=Aquicoccus sp. G2-2 TaxID=3092120 RepID=UPI00366CD55E
MRRLRTPTPARAPDNKTPRKKTPRRGRGALLLIAGLLMSSAFIRLGRDAGQAFASQPALMSRANDAPKATPAHDPAAQCTPPPDIAAMLAAFQAREARLKEREARMEMRMRALSVTDREISKRMTSLTTAEEKLRATLALADSAAENDLAKLTAVYESMKPKDAAALFEQMDASFSAGFLSRMRPEAAAAIMAGLTPNKAYTISAILAGRNAEVPTE